MKILIIDDDFQRDTDCIFMKEYFNQFGIEWEFVEDGYKGVSLLKENPGKYAGVFLDVEFNKRAEGPEHCDAIRKFDSLTPIIWISGNKSNNEYLSKRKRKGAFLTQGYISKDDWRRAQKDGKVKERIEKILQKLSSSIKEEMKND